MSTIQVPVTDPGQIKPGDTVHYSLSRTPHATHTRTVLEPDEDGRLKTTGGTTLVLQYGTPEARFSGSARNLTVDRLSYTYNGEQFTEGEQVSFRWEDSDDPSHVITTTLIRIDTDTLDAKPQEGESWPTDDGDPIIGLEILGEDDEPGDGIVDLRHADTPSTPGTFLATPEPVVGSTLSTEEEIATARPGQVYVDRYRDMALSYEWRVDGSGRWNYRWVRNRPGTTVSRQPEEGWTTGSGGSGVVWNHAYMARHRSPLTLVRVEGAEPVQPVEEAPTVERTLAQVLAAPREGDAVIDRGGDGWVYHVSDETTVPGWDFHAGKGRDASRERQTSTYVIARRHGRVGTDVEPAVRLATPEERERMGLTPAPTPIADELEAVASPDAVEQLRRDHEAWKAQLAADAIRLAQLHGYCTEVERFLTEHGITPTGRGYTAKLTMEVEVDFDLREGTYGAPGRGDVLAGFGYQGDGATITVRPTGGYRNVRVRPGLTTVTDVAIRG